MKRGFEKFRCAAKVYPPYPSLTGLLGIAQTRLLPLAQENKAEDMVWSARPGPELSDEAWLAIVGEGIAPKLSNA